MSNTHTTLAALKNSGRQITAPFLLTLPDGSTLTCNEILRMLPNKRLVVRATHNQQPVLAKLFFDGGNWKKEIAGYAQLQKTGVTTPALLAQHTMGDGGICLYTFIANAQPLDALWQQADEASKQQYLQQLLPCLQTLWQHRLLQRDLHLGNFLLQTLTENQTEILWVLDPASCENFTRPSAQQENIALLIAQLPLPDWSWVLQQLSTDKSLTDLVKQQWQKRLQQYLKKIFRDCTEIADISPNNQLHILCHRAALNDALANVLHKPEQFTQQATMLKNGNSAKVFLLDADGKKWVVKQYINKDWLRKLRRAFRPSRAARSWYFCHAFAFAGIAVPAPIALIERKKGFVVTDAWFISEYCADGDLLTRWQQHAPSREELLNVQALFQSLQQLHISHGDMKATNLLSDGKRITVIDYDGAKEHRHAASLQQALRKDTQRLLQNWINNTQLQQQLAECLVL